MQSVKHHLNKVLRGASYEYACTKSQVIGHDLNCFWLMFLSLRQDGNMFQVWGAMKIFFINAIPCLSDNWWLRSFGIQCHQEMLLIACSFSLFIQDPGLHSSQTVLIKSHVLSTSSQFSGSTDHLIASIREKSINQFDQNQLKQNANWEYMSMNMYQLTMYG